MPGSARDRVLVLGAGIVGVSTALQLRQRGWETLLLDQREPGTACSYGNAGILANDIVPPVAAPGVLGKIPGYLMDPEAPLAIRFSYLPRLLPWLYHFLRCSRREVYERNTRAMATLLLSARSAYEPLLTEAGAADLLHATGALQVFETEASFADARRDADFRRSLGSSVQDVAAYEIPQFAKGLAPVFAGALFRPDLGYFRDPLALTTALHRRYLELGGSSQRVAVERLERRIGERWGVIGRSADGAEAAFEAGQVVVAAGAWSTRLLRGLRLPIPLDTERGYHVMLPHARPEIPLPVSTGEGAFYLTPMDGGLRLAGTVEMAGLSRPPDPRRPEAILRRARRYLPGLDERDAETWMGFRPSLPDSLPVIGPVEGLPGLTLAFGHAHLGVTLGALTGRLVAQAVSGEKPDVDLTPFRHDRF